MNYMRNIMRYLKLKKEAVDRKKELEMTAYHINLWKKYNVIPKVCDYDV